MPNLLNKRMGNRALKLLVYTDGSAASTKALKFAARLTQKLNAELTIITSRSGTHAAEQPPPFGQDIDLSDHKALPPGLQVLGNALDFLSAEGLFEPQETVQLRELSNGYIFFCNTPAGQRVPFYVCFGHMVETLNREIGIHHYDLLIIAPPQKKGMRRMKLGDISRKLVLELHTSVLITRGGDPDSRFVVCADGSNAAKRQFPMLKQLMPAIIPPVELVCVLDSGTNETAVEEADACLSKAALWLAACGKQHKIHRLEGSRPAEAISDVAGDDAVIFLGASLRHEVYRRILGSLPIQILARTKSTVLIVKALPEDDEDLFEDRNSC
jgi:nucleotide-binding universal stress UspA family protein